MYPVAPVRRILGDSSITLVIDIQAEGASGKKRFVAKGEIIQMFSEDETAFALTKEPVEKICRLWYKCDFCVASNCRLLEGV